MNEKCHPLKTSKESVKDGSSFLCIKSSIKVQTADKLCFMTRKMSS